MPSQGVPLYSSLRIKAIGSVVVSESCKVQNSAYMPIHQCVTHVTLGQYAHNWLHYISKHEMSCFAYLQCILWSSGADNFPPYLELDCLETWKRQTVLSHISFSRLKVKPPELPYLGICGNLFRIQGGHVLKVRCPSPNIMTTTLYL